MTDTDALNRILISQEVASVELKAMRESVEKLEHAVLGSDESPGLRRQVDKLQSELESLRESYRELKKDRKSGRQWINRTILGGIVVLLLAKLWPVVQSVMEHTDKSHTSPF